ncbi:hypothetical protein ACQ4PT_051596 [Festuca glaucescens]
MEIVENVGKGPNRLSESPDATLPAVIPKGKTRPVLARIAANIVTECNKAVRKFVPVCLHWSKYKGDAGLLCNYYSKVAESGKMDIKFSPVKKHCTNLLQKGLQQCRYLLKKKYFDIDPNDVPKESPVPSMNNDECKALVDHWRHPKTVKICVANKKNRSKVQYHQSTGSRSYEVHLQNLGDKYKGKEPSPLDIFKECHFSQKNGFSTAVKDAIAEMENQLTIPTTDGRCKTEIQVLSEEPSCRTGEKRGSAKLQDVVKNQHDQKVELTSQVQEAEKKWIDMEGTIDTLTKIIQQQS